MKSRILAVSLALFCLPVIATAEDMTLQQQVDEVKAQIEREKVTQEQLRSDLDSMDAKIEELRSRLEELEAKIKN